MNDAVSTWKENLYRGLPALIVAGLAILLAAYGKYVLPPRLSPRYSQQLAEFKQQYADGVEDTSRLIELGSSINICYSRLESLGVAHDEWERMEFIESFVAALRARLSNDLQEELRKRIESQIFQFTDMQERLIAKLAAAESPYAKQANLRLAQRALASGYDPSRAEAVLESLQALLNESPDDQQLRSQKAELLYERAWWLAQQRGELPPPAEQFTEAAGYVSPPATDVTTQLPLLAGEASSLRLHLELLAMRDAQQAVSVSQSLLDQISSQRSFNEYLQTAILAHAILGNWDGLRSLLSQKFALADADEQHALRKQVSRSVARLYFSRLPDQPSAWRDECWQGLQLSMQLNPGTFEIYALLWELALKHADFPSSMSSQFVEAILISESDQRYLILAISNALRGQTDKAMQYLELGRRGDEAALTRLSNIVLWRCSVAEAAGRVDAPIVSLKPVLSEALNDDDAIGWIALARLQMLSGENAKAKESLMIARKTFENSDVIDAMLKIAEERMATEEVELQ